MNFKKIITYYYLAELSTLIIGYFLIKSEVKFSPDYIGIVIAISCAIGFGLAFYFIFLLLNKKLTINKFTIYFLLSLFGVVLPYLFMLTVVSYLPNLG